MENTMFKWIPFYEELADKLLEYKNKPKRLVNLIYKHFDSEDASFLYDDSKKEMPIFEEIDPFTIYSIFNRNKGTRRELAQTMKDAFEISAESPLTFEGIPVQNYSNLSFVARHKAADGDAKRLWQLFELALSQDAEQEDVGKVFDRVLKQLCIGMAKITMGLYYIRPYDFLALDGNNVNYLDNYGIIVDPKKMNYADYVNLMNEVKDKMKDKTIKEQSFPEFSLAAVGENYNEELNNELVDEYIDLLRSNHNLILTGAPGTGKTYLAKQIAQKMIFGEVKEKMNDGEQKQFNEQCEFVQFHPSYDYTDFVEGLRPLDDGNGNVGFERKDGIFKEFCAKALDNLENSQKDESVLSKEFSVEKRYLWLLSQIENEEISEIPLKTNGKKLLVEKVSDFKNIILKAPNTTSSRTYTVSLKRILKLSKVYTDTKSLNAISNISVEVRNAIGGCNASAYWAVLNLLYKEQDSSSQTNALNNKVEKKDFVFIIDEINRGEINKIFGELFFSIDPGYRGKDGKVRTQYASMQEEPNDFDMALGVSEKCGNFFVPENVYIIGTMNDIDRSVESMDFAFRRRFAFKEVTADDSKAMLDSAEAWGKDENGNSLKPDDETIGIAREKLENINKVIWHKLENDEKEEDKPIEGLSSAYHIGASYFLKLTNYKKEDGSYNFDELWEYHLEGLLFEYLRGTTDIYKKLKRLAIAYGYSNADKYE